MLEDEYSAVPSPLEVGQWRAVEYTDLPGWDSDDHQAAMACFRMSASHLLNPRTYPKGTAEAPRLLIDLAQKADGLRNLNTSDSRNFFESEFTPFRFEGGRGFVTGYFEPELPASRVQTSRFTYPIYAKPDDLVEFGSEAPPADLPDGVEFGRRTDDGILEYFDRAEIENGALAGRSLAIFWLESSIDGFFVHIQGSARLSLSDGGKTRITYAAKNGHPYRSIGRLLIDRGEFQPAEMTMQSLRAWLEQHPDQAQEVMAYNRSYIFFTESTIENPDFGPVAAAGVQLTPGRSLAVDRRIHAYGTPVFVTTNEPLPRSQHRFSRLMIAQDTGSAIVGPARGDLFIGSGNEAGLVAGGIKHEAEFYVLLPNPTKNRKC